MTAPQVVVTICRRPSTVSLGRIVGAQSGRRRFQPLELPGEHVPFPAGRLPLIQSRFQRPVIWL